MTAPLPVPALALSGITMRYGAANVVEALDLEVPQGVMAAIVGPNGAGKSSLLKGALGLLPCEGTARFFGRPLTGERARIAYVPQRSAVDWDFPARVIDVVMMGLYRQIGLFRFARAHHRARAEAAIARVGLTDFSGRQIGRLSGGQQQRVFLARALAQDADLYLLDEPFAGVDAATEETIVAVLRALVREGRTVLAVHHDLSTLAAYFDIALFMNVRRIAAGPVGTVLNAETLRATYAGALPALAFDPLGAAA